MRSARPAVERVGLTIAGVLLIVLAEALLRGVLDAPSVIVYGLDLIGLALAASGPGIPAIGAVVDLVLRRAPDVPPRDREAP